MKKLKKRIHFIKGDRIFNPKQLSNRKEEKKKKPKRINENKRNGLKINSPFKKTKKFEIKKENEYLSKFDPTINYFNEYWKMYYENEYILAKIKETVYEINAMEGHVDELNNINSNVDR
jgi:hypothetical protein